MEIYLCRHGETDHNNNGIVQGQMNEVDLNSKGRKQAEKLSERFQDLDIDKFYSSSLDRALQTAKIVAKPHDKEVETSDLLKEVGRSVFEGESFEEMVEEIRSSESSSHEWRPENGETLVEMQERGMEFFNQLKENHAQDDKIVIVAHGGINGGIILGALDHSVRNSYLINQENCCVNKLKFSSRGVFEIESVNDISHL